jgi:methylglutaconyl-CoA hydratase
MDKQDSPPNASLAIDGAVATITLDQPEKHNAFDDRLIATLLSYLDQLRSKPEVRVLKLEATGKHFCAGADLNWMKRMAKMTYDANREDSQQLAKLFKELKNFPLPTVVRVQGAAFGGAIGLIACSDIAIAADNARFCLSEAKLGLAPATIGPYVVAAIGERMSRRFFLTAEVFDVQTAKHCELVHEVVTIDQLDAAVDQAVKNILETGPLASIACKTLLSDIVCNNADHDMSDTTSALIAKLRVSDEGQEGLSAFFEKRLPAWRQVKNNGASNE